MLLCSNVIEENKLLPALAIAGLITALTGLYSALLFVLARWGLESSNLLAAVCVSVVFAGAFAPFLLPARLLASDAGSAIGSVVALSVVASPICAHVFPVGVFLLYPALAAVGLARAMRFFRLDRLDLFALVFLPPLLAVYFVTTMQSLQNGVNLFGPEFAQLGWLTSSAYYHAAIAHLIQHFGIVTTGLDGLGIPERYHFGSHFWFAGLGRLGDKSPLFSYPAGFMVIALPMLMFGVFAFVAARVRAGRATLAYCVATLLWVTMDRFTFATYYQSESYGISLVVLVLSLPLIRDILGGRRDTPNVAIALWICAIFLLVPMTLTKVSTGLLWATLLAAVAVYRWRFSWRSIGMLLAMAAVMVVLLSVSMQDWENLLDSLLGRSKNYLHAAPLQIFRFYLDHPFYTLSVLATVAAASLCLRSSHMERRGAEVIHSSCPADVITLGVMTLVGIAATGIYLGGNDAWYFLQPAQWIAIVVIAIWATDAWDGAPLARLQCCGAFSSLVLAVAALTLVTVQVVKIFFNFDSAIATARTLVYALNKDEAELYGSLDRIFLRRWLMNGLDGSLFDSRLRRGLEATPGGKLFALTSSFVADGRAGKAVFVSPGQYELWRSKFEVAPFPQTFVPPLPRTGCVEIYFIQALTGMPLILGAPPAYPGCEGQVWGQIGKEGAIRTRNLNREELCGMAAQRNLHTVLVLRDIENKDKNEIVRCRSGG